MSRSRLRLGQLGSASGPHALELGRGLRRRLTWRSAGAPPGLIRERLNDVHALFFSENAVALENELHKAFADRRVNHINQRREFFFATPVEVRDVLAEKVGGLLEFTEALEALEYFQSRSLWPGED
jgi:hypothetical protein